MEANGSKNVRWVLGIFMAIILSVMELQHWSTDKRVELLAVATAEDIDGLTEWRDTWVNRVRELDATQSASIQFLKDSLTEIKIDVRALKSQCRADAAEFMRLLLDIRDRMPAKP